MMTREEEKGAILTRLAVFAQTRSTANISQLARVIKRSPAYAKPLLQEMANEGSIEFAAVAGYAHEVSLPADQVEPINSAWKKANPNYPYNRS